MMPDDFIPSWPVLREDYKNRPVTQKDVDELMAIERRYKALLEAVAHILPAKRAE